MIPADSRVEDVLAEMLEARQVCPIPKHWNDVWNRLPNRTHVGQGWQPALPLILAAWWETSDEEKRDRFESHLRWAREHGALADIIEYLNALQPADWHMES